MSTHPRDFVNRGVSSTCCGAAAWGEVVDGVGICADCKEHSSFEDDETEAEYKEERANREAEVKLEERSCQIETTGEERP